MITYVPIREEDLSNQRQSITEHTVKAFYWHFVGEEQKAYDDIDWAVSTFFRHWKMDTQ